MARKFGIRIFAASVSATLTGYPLYVDLSDAPADFWDGLAHEDGGDIRAKAGAAPGSAELPCDVVFINTAERTGSLFVKVPTVDNTVDTEIFIHCGDASDTLPAVGASNGRNAVWSDYHRVFFFSPTDGFEDHTGNGSAAVPVGNVSAFIQTDISGETNSHQGVAFDGTHYYTVDTNVLRKWTSAWSLVASNTDPAGDVGTDVGIPAINHCGDPEVKDGVLYIPVQEWPAGGSGASPHVARFSASTLAYIDAVALAAPTDASAICYVPTDDVFVVTSFFGSTLYTLNPTTLAAVDTIPLSTSVSNIQGVTWWCSRLWVTSDGLASFGGAGFKTKRLFSVAFDGTVTSQPAMRYDAATDSTHDYLEGLAHDDEGLLMLRSTASSNNGRVYKLEPNPRRRGGARLAAANTFSTAAGHLLATGLSRFTTWTIGADSSVGASGATQTIVTYGVSGSSDLTVRASTAWRQATDKLGIWNNADGWLEALATLADTDVHRTHDVHESTTQRKLYLDQVLQATDSTITAMPASGANALYIGIADAGLVQGLNGTVGVLLLRAAALSSDWIAAEDLNLSAPEDFYEFFAPAMVATSVFGEDGTVSGLSYVHLLNLDGVTRTVSDPELEGSAVLGGNLTLIEQASAPAPIANAARLYAIDNGSGKTSLRVIFGTGAAQEIEVEP